MSSRLQVFVCDPSLFTAPYDTALIQALRTAGVDPLLFTRPPRRSEETSLPAELVRLHFYKDVETGGGRKRAWRLRKALSHSRDMNRFVRKTCIARPDLVHFQWLVVPLLDRSAVRRIGRTIPTVLTVHDTTPFNGSPSSRLQALGFRQALDAFDHLVVHTASARERLLAQGIEDRRISIIPHGPLSVAPAGHAFAPDKDARWTVVAFGKLRPYKGLDVLLDAASRLDPERRRQLRIIIAGEPLMAVESLIEQVQQGGLTDVVEFRLHHHSEAEISALTEEADAFVFPYREIEASGVLFLVQNSGRWIIASELGAFREVLTDGANGHLTPPGDPDSLRRALEHGIDQRPIPTQPTTVTSWEAIAEQTIDLYHRLGRTRQVHSA